MECSCAGCPDFAPPEPPFQACGGDPKGFWRLSSFEEHRFDLSIFDGLKVAICPGQIAAPKAGREFLLELKADNTGAAHTAVPVQEVDFASSCLGSTSCEALPYECSPGECGLCRCTIPASGDDVEELTWRAEATQLFLAGEDPVPFCVKDDTLSYQPPGSKNVVSFERLYRAGAPQLCADRILASCAVGDTCTLGACVGTGSCNEAAAQTAAGCAKFQDCAWNANLCWGNVEATCTLRDYAEGVPGCALSEKPTLCGGTPSPCKVQPSCAAPGCLFGPACRGGVFECYPLEPDGVVGCDCSSGACTGTFDCADQSQTYCERALANGTAFGCTWESKACVATATPCEELSPDQCETTLGCYLHRP
jgi:hypothetical protein